ncbi:unnamed protein product [Ilex paraguariensis]|uniref:Uncharacterized protein n=1 Tax=Ilex paraguariensis TaxID=185542 RepID=A0ABC8T2B8_9AQUA
MYLCQQWRTSSHGCALHTVLLRSRTLAIWHRAF